MIPLRQQGKHTWGEDISSGLQQVLCFQDQRKRAIFQTASWRELRACPGHWLCPVSHLIPTPSSSSTLPPFIPASFKQTPYQLWCPVVSYSSHKQTPSRGLKSNDHSKHVVSLNGHQNKGVSEKQTVKFRAYIQLTSKRRDKRKDTLQGFILS